MSYPVDIGAVLRELKAKAKKTTQLAQFRQYTTGDWTWFPPFDTPALYFKPLGSPLDQIAEKGSQWLVRARHRVLIEVVKQVPALDEESFLAAMEGSSEQTGLGELVSDVASYFTNNVLALSGLDPNLPPTVDMTDSGFQDAIVQNEDGNSYFMIGQMIWEGTTQAFDWPIDT